MKEKKRSTGGKSGLVVDAILRYIMQEHLHPGDLLPSEEELTTRLGVSRVCVREGLRGLKFLGLLKSSTSRGTMIQAMDFDILSRCLVFQTAIDNNSFSTLLEARLVLELGVVEQLCGRLTPEQYQELEACVDCTRKDDSPAEAERNAHTDRQFHSMLFKCCGNPVLMSFSNLLEIFFARTFTALGVTECQIATSEHRLLLDALQNGNLELARGIMKQHIIKYEKYIKPNSEE